MDTKKIIDDFLENRDFTGFGKLMDIASYYNESSSTHQAALKNIADIVLDQFEHMNVEEIQEINVDDISYQEADSLVDLNTSDLFDSAGLFADYTDQALNEYTTPENIDSILRLGQLIACFQLIQKILIKFKCFAKDNYQM